MTATPEFRCTFSQPSELRTLSVTHLLRVWHRAGLLGMTVEEFSVGDRIIDSCTLRLVNAWVGADGAWNASKQEYFEAWRRLDAVLNAPIQRAKRKRKPVKVLPVELLAGSLAAL